uniref:Uncharacterized protein n=1 Tax=viral metagenome TaxID=1070528 RepID=A0A6M3JQT2_9ZZZZ
MTSIKTFVTKHGIFIGQKRGECIRLSIPGATENDWSNNTEFIDLPLMNRESYFNFMEAVKFMESVFKE